jgi:hypothetical protein
LHSNKKQQTVIRTFRIKAELDDVLKNEAERQGVSVNHLVNSVLQKYASFDRLARNGNFITLTKHVFGEILKDIPLERLAQAGDNAGQKDIRDVLDMLGLPKDYESFTHIVTKLFGASDRAMWFNCYRSIQENRAFLHLQHDLGRGWSVFLQHYFLSYLKSLDIDCEAKVYGYALNLKTLRQHPFLHSGSDKFHENSKRKE